MSCKWDAVGTNEYWIVIENVIPFDDLEGKNVVIQNGHGILQEDLHSICIAKP